MTALMDSAEGMERGAAVVGVGEVGRPGGVEFGVRGGLVRVGWGREGLGCTRREDSIRASDLRVRVRR